MLQLNFSRAQSDPAEDWAATKVSSCQALAPGVKTKGLELYVTATKCNHGAC